MSRAYGYAAYGGPDTETWFDRPEPTPGPGELTIAVRAAGVNPVDHKIRGGAFANPEDQPAFPLPLGVEAAGVVTAVGKDVTGFAVGDAVVGKAAAGHGAYAEHAVLQAATTVAKPTQLPFVQAAALPVAGGTAWDVLEQLHLAEGETLLVNGVGGGVGVMTAQLARDRGIAVIGIGSEDKRALVESLGAILVAHDQGDPADGVRALLPDGPQAVLDLVGGGPLRAVADLLDDHGRLISVADPGVAELGGEFLVSAGTGLADLVELAANGKIDPKVLETYPFDEAPQALRAVETGHTPGKIVIDLTQTTEV